MTMPARTLRWRGTGEYRDQAEPLLERAGDVAGVVRGRPRSLLIKCPDGCGETLVINLDERAGKAWAIDIRQGTLSLFPSVWREDGCRSHFILWRDRIIWCGPFELGNEEPAYDAALEAVVLASLDERRLRGGVEIAIDLGEIPWDVLRALRRLVLAGMVEEGRGDLRNHFRRASGRGSR